MDEATNADSQRPEQERKSGDPFHASHPETEVVVGKKQPEGRDRCDSEQAGAPPQGGRNSFCQADPRYDEADIARCHDEEGTQEMLVLIDVRRSQPSQHKTHASTGEQKPGRNSGPAAAPEDTTGQRDANNQQHSQDDERSIHQTVFGGTDIPRLRVWLQSAVSVT